MIIPVGSFKPLGLGCSLGDPVRVAFQLTAAGGVGGVKDTFTPRTSTSLFLEGYINQSLGLVNSSASTTLGFKMGTEGHFSPKKFYYPNFYTALLGGRQWNYGGEENNALWQVGGEFGIFPNPEKQFNITIGAKAELPDEKKAADLSLSTSLNLGWGL